MICIKYQSKARFCKVNYKQLFIIKSLLPNSSTINQIQQHMISKNFRLINSWLQASQLKQDFPLFRNLFSTNIPKYQPYQKSPTQPTQTTPNPKSLHTSRQSTPPPITRPPRSNSPCHNNLLTVSLLHHNSFTHNPLTLPTPSPHNLAHEYPTITLDLQAKYQSAERILQSPSRNIYKIVEEMMIVLESFAQLNRREVVEDNVVKVVRQFNNKLTSAHLENTHGTEQREEIVTTPGQQQTDSTYALHEGYLKQANQQEPQGQGRAGTLDADFLFFYVETLKEWVLSRVQTDAVVRQVEQQMYEFLTAREVSDVQHVLRKAIDQLKDNYIYQKQTLKRDRFPFDRKLRSLCLLPYLDSKEQIEHYLDRLTEQNLIIYLKPSQLTTLIYDIVQTCPNLYNTSLVYQIQSTKVYQNLGNLNSCYIKCLFIRYVRKFMVCYQEIQFYEIFRQVSQKLKYPTIRSFIRLAMILKTEGDDLHCEYNKVMNRFNYNILISFITSQTFNIQNTRFDEMLELFQSLNDVESTGEILYQQMTKYLRNYMLKGSQLVEQKQLQRLFKLFKHVINQAKPLFKYEQKDGLNKQFSRKTIALTNILFDILLQKYPQTLTIGNRYIKTYLQPEQPPSSCLSNPLMDSSPITIELPTNQLTPKRLKTINKSLSTLLDMQVHTRQLLQTIFIFMRLKMQVREEEDVEKNVKGNLNLVAGFNDKRQFGKEVYRKVLQPMLQQAAEKMLDRRGNKETKLLYRNIFLALECINLIGLEDQTVIRKAQRYLTIIQKSIFRYMQERLAQKASNQQKQLQSFIVHFKLSVARGDNQILLCLYETIILSKKLASTVTLTPLPLIFTFINTIGIQNFKAIQECDILNMLKLMKTLQELRSQQGLLAELSLSVYEDLYYSFSMFVAFLADRGRYFFKLNSSNAEVFLDVVAGFVAKKGEFVKLASKKKIVCLQAVLVVLIRKKYIKLKSTHLKRSQHARILLDFMQIFSFPENFILDLKKIVQQTQFVPGDLQDYSHELLERFIDTNWSIARYLQDNKLSVTSSKKVNKMTTQQLRKQFQAGQSSKIYQMIVRSSKFTLPFTLPQPRTQDTSAKMLYTIQNCYQKLSVRASCSIPSCCQPSPSRRLRPVQQPAPQTPSPNPEPTVPYPPALLQQLLYIKSHSLARHNYEDHYKMSQTSLPVHYKKQTWKQVGSVAKDLEIESLEIDQRVGRNVYEMVLLVVLGYLEKVKKIAAEFHSHGYVQHVVLQLDLEVHFTGCVARVSRKGSNQDSLLVVSATESNYKIMFICTQVLRQSGENAYILSEKNKEADLKEFLEKMLPQTLQEEEPEIVDKFVKTGTLGEQDQIMASNKIQ